VVEVCAWHEIIGNSTIVVWLLDVCGKWQVYSRSNSKIEFFPNFTYSALDCIIQVKRLLILFVSIKKTKHAPY